MSGFYKIVTESKNHLFFRSCILHDRSAKGDVHLLSIPLAILLVVISTIWQCMGGTCSNSWVFNFWCDMEEAINNW